MPTTTGEADRPPMASKDAAEISEDALDTAYDQSFRTNKRITGKGHQEKGCVGHSLRSIVENEQKDRKRTSERKSTRPDTRHKMRLVCVLFTFENNTGHTDLRTDGHDLL